MSFSSTIKCLSKCKDFMKPNGYKIVKTGKPIRLFMSCHVI